MNFHLMAQRKVWLTFLNKTSSIILPCQIVTYVLNSFLDNGFFMCWKDEISQTIISAFCQNNFARLFLNYCKRFFDCPLRMHKYATRVGSLIAHPNIHFSVPILYKKACSIKSLNSKRKNQNGHFANYQYYMTSKNHFMKNIYRLV